ncbi:TSCPD domain-containing protein [Aeromonas crassostreae]
MVKKIDRKIVAYKVKTRDEPQDDLVPQDDVVHMHETVLRPERLMGTTYKLKTPEHVSEHSLFITINDIVLNEGTVHETRRPFEIFINSKSLEHYQWIVALTRIISAVFRKGGDVTFLVEELRSVFDPKGGYWNKGKYVPSLIAEIGNVIETHLTEIGMLKVPGPDEHQQEFLAEQQTEAQQVGSGFPASAALCYKCHTRALVRKDGCMTCLNCGDSKCG